MKYRLLASLLLLVWVCRISSSPRVIGECEKKAHLSLSAKQRKQLCETTTTGEYSVGPAICSITAKDKLHFNFDDILKLCVDAVSAAPADCYGKIEKAQQKSIGFKLCQKTESTLPAECYSELTQTGVWRGSNGKQQKVGQVTEQIVDFCKQLEDRSPLYCVQAAKNLTQLPTSQILHLCKDVVGSGDSSQYHPLNNMASTCIKNMAIYIKPSLGITAEDIIQFCTQINHRQYPGVIKESDLAAFSSAAVVCFESLTALVSDRSYQGPVLSMRHRLGICRNAPVPLGPVNCTGDTIEKVATKEPHLKLKGEDLVALCSGALCAGPSDCFVESKGLGNTDIRTELCHSATNYGPAHCFRRANNVFRKDPENKMVLCVSATSEGPAACAAAAPQYLASDEKIHLCEDAPVQSFMDPIKCLQAVQSSSKTFVNAPKKALGYFQENIQLDSDWTSRGLMISLCSFSDSHDPLAAAECFKSVPPSLHHDDAVMMCTNVSSSEVIQHIQLCYRILPKSWPSESVRLLCEGLLDRLQTEAAVKCAVDLAKITNFPMEDIDIARVCSSESKGNPVLQCVKKLHQGLPSSSSFNTNHTYHSICFDAKSIEPAECFLQIQGMSSSVLAFDFAVPQKLCRSPDYRSVLTCLSRQSQRSGRHLITLLDLQTCSEEKRIPNSLRLKRLVTEDNDIEITAGRRFSLWFEVYDQFDQLFQPSHWPSSAETADNQEVLFKASINENNLQGAVLWGIRSNVTANGMLQLNSLVMSQPGNVEFKLSFVAMDAFGISDGKTKGKVLASFKLVVRADPRIEKTAPCLFVFHRSQCPHDAREEDWIAYFPNIRSYSASQHYLHNIYCSDDEALKTWHVDAHLNANGAMWVEYRHGIDAIWTNIGLPRMEMSAEERLGLSLPANMKSLSRAAKKNLVKTIKRAYYKASLQWHPDRWSGYDQYQYAVQGAFQLITEAYEAIMESINTNENQEMVDSEEPIIV